MSLPESVDRLNAGWALYLRHFIQPVEQRQHAVVIDPCLRDLAWYVILPVEFFDEPHLERLSLLGPGRQVKHDGDRMPIILCGSVEQIARKFEQQRGLAAPRRTQDEQRTL